jgi:hypothetical protein
MMECRLNTPVYTCNNKKCTVVLVNGCRRDLAVREKK